MLRAVCRRLGVEPGEISADGTFTVERAPCLGLCEHAPALLAGGLPIGRADPDPSGIRLFKLWFSVSREEQARRFKERKRDPLKQWKLSPVDLASMDKWEAYTQAKEEMFFHTDTADAPWTPNWWSKRWPSDIA